MSVSLQILNWSGLNATERVATLRRPAQKNAAELFESVRAIIDAVRERGDAALLEFTQRFDGVALEALEVTPHEFAAAEVALSEIQKAALERAIANVHRFHEAQKVAPLRM
jgi:histidinol dehydrogenase